MVELHTAWCSLAALTQAIPNAISLQIHLNINAKPTPISKGEIQ